MAQNMRGFGYWLWKPLLVTAMLDEMEEGAILLYADGGCEFSRLGTERFKQYVALADRHGGLFFRLPHAEIEYSKRELREFLATSAEEDASPQVQATLFMIKNSAEGRAFVAHWLATCRKDGMRLLTDDLDPEKQSERFIGHRHDQSILSILVKRSRMWLLDAEDHFDKRLYLIVNSWILLFPFHARRARRTRIVPLMARLSNEAACRRSLASPLSFKLQFIAQSLLSRRGRLADLRQITSPHGNAPPDRSGG